VVAAERADPALITDARVQQVLDLAREVTARHDLADVLATTLSGLRRLVTFGGGSIQLLDEDGWISMAAADPPAPEDVMAIRIPLGASAGGRVILTERPVYLPDVRVESDVPSKNVTPGGIRSYFGVPLMADGQAVGLVQLDSPEPDAWSEADRLVVMCSAPAISAAITNARAAARRAEAEA
jgi:GAF domain-containing protein